MRRPGRLARPLALRTVTSMRVALVGRITHSAAAGRVRHRPLREPEGGELAGGDDSVLAGRERRYALIDDFQTCAGWKSSFGWHAPRLAGRSARVSPRL